MTPVKMCSLIRAFAATVGLGAVSGQTNGADVSSVFDRLLSI